MEFLNELNTRLKLLNNLHAESSKDIREHVRFVDVETNKQHERLSGIVTGMKGKKGIGRRDLEDRITEFSQKEDIWTLDCPAHVELIDLITEHGKEIERVRFELSQTDIQCIHECDEFVAGTWRDVSSIQEHSEEQRKEWKESAEHEVAKWNKIGQRIRKHNTKDANSVQTLDTQARKQYRSIMEEREKICEEGQEVLKHCIKAEISFYPYGLFLGYLREREQELRDQRTKIWREYRETEPILE